MGALYKRIFSTFAKQAQLRVNIWGDKEVRELLLVLDHLSGLKEIEIDNRWPGCLARISEETTPELETALGRRGIVLNLRQYPTKVRTNGFFAPGTNCFFAP